MKRTALALQTIFLMMVTFNSCQKELTDPNLSTTTTTGGTGDFRAKINGVQFIASAASGSRVSGLIAVAGIGGGKQMVITLQDSGVHHYTLDQTSMQAAAYTDSASGSINAFASNQSSNPTQAGGSVDITSIDTANKKFSGTFRFLVYRQFDSTQRTVSEGSFTNISYATTTPPRVSTDTFTVKIDNVLFVPFTISGIHVTLFNQISIGGTDQNGTKSVSVLVPDNVTPGTYPITTIGGTYFGQYNKNATTFLFSDIGQLTILEHNTTTKRIKGNFNFHASEILTPTSQAVLSSGYFSLVYQ